MEYTKSFIDFADKPKWCIISLLCWTYCVRAGAKVRTCRLFDVNSKGSVPVVKDTEEDKWCEFISLTSAYQYHSHCKPCAT